MEIKTINKQTIIGENDAVVIAKIENQFDQGLLLSKLKLVIGNKIDASCDTSVEIYGTSVDDIKKLAELFTKLADTQQGIEEAHALLNA